MRKRVLLALGVATVVWVLVANSLPSFAGAPPTDWSRPRVVQTSGLTVFHPRAWDALTDGSTITIWSRGDPAHRSANVNRIPDGGVWIWVIDYGRLPRLTGFAPRPAHFELTDDDLGFQSCGFGFDGWNLTFSDHGVALQAIVGLGAGARKSDATALLDRLRVSS